MENYLYLDGKKIELSPELVNALQNEMNRQNPMQMRLSDKAVGETFKIGTYEFVVLEHDESEQVGACTLAILKDLWKNEVTFGSSNNYAQSNVRELLRDFQKEIESIVGEDNLICHLVDLTSDDGLKDYGEVLDKVSLLTTEKYRKYVYVLDQHKPDQWWWLATPYTTPTHENASWIKCVSPSGYLRNDGYYNDYYGVRPFCVFSSSIFVS